MPGRAVEGMKYPGLEHVGGGTDTLERGCEGVRRTWDDEQLGGWRGLREEQNLKGEQYFTLDTFDLRSLVDPHVEKCSWQQALRVKLAG